MYRKVFYRRVSRCLSFVATCMLLFACSKSNVKQGQGVPQNMPRIENIVSDEIPQSSVEELANNIAEQSIIAPGSTIVLSDFEDLDKYNPQTGVFINDKFKTALLRSKKLHGVSIISDITSEEWGVKDAVRIYGTYKQDKNKFFVIRAYSEKGSQKKSSAVKVSHKSIKIPKPEKNADISLGKIAENVFGFNAKRNCGTISIPPFRDDSLYNPKTGKLLRKIFGQFARMAMFSREFVSDSEMADCIAAGRYDRRNVRGKDSICVFARLSGKDGIDINSAMSCFETKSLNKVPVPVSLPKTCDFKDKYVYVKPFVNMGEPNLNDGFIKDVILGQINGALLKDLPSSFITVNEESAQMIIEGKYKVNTENGKCSNIDVDITCKEKDSFSSQPYNSEKLKNAVDCSMLE